ncbi:MAG: glycosyltransferase family 39 protein [Candidatus Shapirobacteria bacterium]
MKIKRAKIRTKYILLAILLLGFLVRVCGFNWDQGFHLHPDERMIVMVIEKLHFPDKLNPHFFAYGSLPLYLLKFFSWLISIFFGPFWVTYSYLPILGRAISIFFDLGTIVVIFKIGQKVWGKKVGLWSALFYASCVFPLQLSHFYAVDTTLNFFIWLTVYFFLIFYQEPNYKNALKIGFAFGLSLATKISAGLLLVGMGVALLADLFLRKTAQRKIQTRIAKGVLIWGGFVLLVTMLTFAFFEPYALLDFFEFKKQILAQEQMTKNAYVFPYTLQYVGTTPYFYYLKNMFFWGMGLGLGILTIIGSVFYFIDFGKRLKTKGDYDQEALELIVVIFGLIYFLVVGRFAVKFMRYFLPLYPWFIFMGVVFLSKILEVFKNIWGKIILGILFVFHLGWLLAFASIYSRPHSRVQASYWIQENIPPGSVIAVEHWDDRLPLFGAQKYQYLEMPLYESDNSLKKWELINNNLKKADYLILASNRLFTPLPRLEDCEKYARCYPKTAQYYRDLFSGELGFNLIAEFTSYPSLRIGSWKFEVNDQSADESFTVYDHPRVLIFQKQ